MDLSKIDIDGLLAQAEQALSFAEMLAPLGGPIAVEGVSIAKATISALETLRDDVSLESEVLAAKTVDALAALKPRLDALQADTEKRLDEA